MNQCAEIVLDPICYCGIAAYDSMNNFSCACMCITSIEVVFEEILGNRLALDNEKGVSSPV